MCCIALGTMALDQWSKWLIERTLSPFDSLDVVPGFLKIIQVTNSGIAFGLFPSHGSWFGTALLALFGIAALAIVTYYFLKAPPDQTLLLIALALVMGGALGNLTDRILLGEVTDFLDFYIQTHHWPTFNVADSAISVGIGLLALETLLPARRQEEDPLATNAEGGLASEPN